MPGPIAKKILTAVDERGVMLVHDRVLPSVTQLVVGMPVSGSWWSHPQANSIYNALTEIEDDVATVKLVRRKETLVAHRLWPHLVDVGLARTGWQVDGLDREAAELLAAIDAGPGPLTVDKARRASADDLERRLLVHTTHVHTPAGHHRKAYGSWHRWARSHRVAPAGDGAGSAAVFEELVAGWASPGRTTLLPWMQR